ncbi:hypothetical protein EJD97_001558, partial [Solanum chilense]
AVMDSVIPYLENSSSSIIITLDDRHDGSSQAQWSVEGLRSITLKLLEFGYKDYFSNHYNKLAGQIIMATTIRHELCNCTLFQTSSSSFASSLGCHLRTVTGTTNRH